MDRDGSDVEAYIDSVGMWQEELRMLRSIILPFGMSEELKWGKPCYSVDGGNVLILQKFKNFCAVLFVKGALLQDRQRILEKPGENTQAARRIPFTGAEQIAQLKPVLEATIAEAISIEKAGETVSLKKTEEYGIPAELQKRLDENPAFKAAFSALTPGRQRAYILYFSAPKKSATRESRLERYVQQILDGKGLHDVR